MQIKLTPQRRDSALSLSKSGDTLTINGVPFAFSGIAEGAALPREDFGCDWLASDVTRTDGTLQLTLILPIGPDAPEAAKFPAPIMVTQDGPIALPPHSGDPA